MPGARIAVGDHCLLSALVRIHDNDGHPLGPARRRRAESITDAEVAAVKKRIPKPPKLNFKKVDLQTITYQERPTA